MPIACFHLPWVRQTSPSMHWCLSCILRALDVQKGLTGGARPYTRDQKSKAALIRRKGTVATPLWAETLHIDRADVIMYWSCCCALMQCVGLVLHTLSLYQ